MGIKFVYGENVGATLQTRPYTMVIPDNFFNSIKSSLTKPRFKPMSLKGSFRQLPREEGGEVNFIATRKESFTLKLCDC